MSLGPKVTELDTERKKNSDKKAGAGGLQKLRQGINAAATTDDLKPILKKMLKLLGDE